MGDQMHGVPDPLNKDGQVAEGTPAAGSEKETFDYEHAYGELRPAYTQATQQAAQYRDRLTEYEALFDALHDPDPEVQAQAAEAIGLELAGGSPEPQRANAEEEFVDPLEETVKSLEQEVEQLRAAREAETTERQSQEMEAVRDEYIGEAISMIEESLTPEGSKDTFKFSEREEEILGNLAIAMTGEDGVPDVKSAYQALYGTDGVLEINRKRWIETKTDAHPAPFGTTIPADKKPRTARDRVAYADERWSQLQSQQ